MITVQRSIIVSADYESSARGAIHNMEEYLRAKTVDHSEWNFPRRSSMMDVDAFIDNDGRQLYIELNKYTADWHDLPDGQHMAYRNIVITSAGMHVAVLAKHRTPKDRPILSRSDVTEFTVIYYDEDAGVSVIGNIVYKHIIGNDAWTKFVDSWMVGRFLLFP